MNVNNQTKSKSVFILSEFEQIIMRLIQKFDFKIYAFFGINDYNNKFPEKVTSCLKLLNFSFSQFAGSPGSKVWFVQGHTMKIKQLWSKCRLQIFSILKMGIEYS